MKKSLNYAKLNRHVHSNVATVIIPEFESKLASELGHGLRIIGSLIPVFVKLWVIWLLIFAA